MTTTYLDMYIHLYTSLVAGIWFKFNESVIPEWILQTA